MAEQRSRAKQEWVEQYLPGERGFHRPIEPIPTRSPDQPIPLSYAQEQVWLHAQMVPDVPLYNEPLTLHYSGALDVAALERSFNEVLRRHEAWRTCFKIVEGEPVQDVKPSLSATLTVVDLRVLPKEQRDSAASLIAHQDARQPIPLDEAPLFRTRLIRLEEDSYRLYLTLSHIIFDGFAIYRVFLPELSQLYRAYAAGNPSPLEELSIQYPDYVFWQRQALSLDVLQEHIAFWKRKLGPDLPVLDLPLDRPRPSVPTFRGNMHVFMLDGKLTAELKRMSCLEGVTLFQTLLAGFAALLCRYSGQHDIPIGTVTIGRDRPELAALLGYFLNNVVLRADLSGDLSFRELVMRMRNATLEALEHDCVPWGRLIQELNPARDRSRHPFFQVMLSLAPPIPEIDPAWRLTQMDVDTGATKYDLYLELDERRRGVLARFHYSTDLFDPVTIARMVEHWQTLLEGAASNPQLRVSELPLLTASERQQLLVESNRTQSVYPQHECIHQAFDTQCERTPDGLALRQGNRELTFRELGERSDQLAQHLGQLGAGSGVRIAVFLDRSFDLVVSLLGILKTGAAYVPLDPSYPAEWLAFVLKDSGAALLITHQKLTGRLPKHQAQLVCLDTEWETITIHSSATAAANTEPPDLAYVLYTSGSTGMPKGVEGTHRGVLNRAGWMGQAYPFAAGEVCCQKTNVGFVDSVWEIFGPLLAGIPSVIIPQETLRDPEQLLETLAREQVTRIVLVPLLLRVLLEHDPRLGERVPRLRLWSSSGEALPPELVVRFRAGSPEAKLLNLYGSAEVAADATWHEVGEEDGRATTVSIGRPIGNLQVYILDEQRNPVATGVRGEIYVGGAGLARGYWGRAELTAERFVANPFGQEAGSRLYRTGDVGRWRANGEIEYLGRVDNQVKLRGMRVELGEVEAVLGRHVGVEEAVVELSGEGEQQRLTAYVRVSGAEGTGATEVTAGELRRFMRGQLPEHMVPASYRRMGEWPLLPSGKVDRRAVARAGGEALKEGEGWAAPRTEVEAKLAGMWQELLKLERVGIDQNFFELGGHSLLALQVMARIRSQLGVELAVRSLFEGATIAALALEVEKAERLGQKARPSIVPRQARSASDQPEALLAQLDTLSPAELETLLQRMRNSKHEVRHHHVTHPHIQDS
jgi:amino acid adenylation domain-containing protein